MKSCSAFTFRVKQSSTAAHTHDPEDEGTINFQNVRNYSPYNKGSHPGRLESSSFTSIRFEFFGQPVSLGSFKKATQIEKAVQIKSPQPLHHGAALWVMGSIM